MEYEIKVYRTVTQSVSIIKEIDKELIDSERGYNDQFFLCSLRMAAEDEAAEMSDHEWKDEDSDIEYTMTSIEIRK